MICVYSVFHYPVFRVIKVILLIILIAPLFKLFFCCIHTSNILRKTMPSNKPKMLFVLEQELIDRIDDYRFDNRINSRAEAIRRLIEAGLKAESSKPKAKKK